MRQRVLMARLCAAVVAVCQATPVVAAAPAHIWSKSFGTTGSSSRGFGVTTDASGNVLIAGSFNGTVNFGGVGLVAQGTDVVVAKYNSAGVHLWSKRFGGTMAEQAYALATDASGNVLVTGYFQGTAGFGGTVLTSGGNNDIFVAKYDASGNHLWSRQLGTTDLDIGNSIVADNTGEVIVTGYLHGIVPSDIALAKYNATGTVQWIKVIGSVEGYDEGLSVASDAAGNIIMTGSFAGDVDFGGGNLSTSSIDDWDAFLVKYNAAGTHLWSSRFGNADLESGFAVKSDPASNVLVTGYFSGTVNFGGADLTSASGDVDVFLAKYDPDGAHVWSRRFGGTSFENATSLAVDASSNVFLGGYFSGTANFGGPNLQSAGNVDIFFAEYRPDGSYVSSQCYGGTAADAGQSIAVDGAGNRYLTGYFAGQVNFGGGMLSSSGTPDVFLAKYSSVVTAADSGPALDALYISAAPNPFNPSTTLSYRIPSAGRVTIAVYDVRGQLVDRLLDEHTMAGTHTVRWQGRGRDGNTLASGMYFARIEHERASQTLKLMLLK